MTRRRRRGFYCTNCGATYTAIGSGAITCQQCGHLGLRMFHQPPVRITCPDPNCNWTGWDDGGVNNDADRHARTHTAEAAQ